MRTRLPGLAFLAFLVLASACGAANEPATLSPPTAPAADTTVPQGEPAVETTVPEADRPDGDSVTAPPDTRPAPDPNREMAPDFALALSDGSTFVLSEETRPVFMVFWAEW